MPKEQNIFVVEITTVILVCDVLYMWPQIFILFTLNSISYNVFRWIHFIIFIIRILSCELRNVHQIWPCDKDLFRDYGFAKYFEFYILIILITYIKPLPLFFFCLCVLFLQMDIIFLCAFFVVVAHWLSDSISLSLSLSRALSLSFAAYSLLVWKSTSYLSLYHTYLVLVNYDK
jgi:hypothetical protein